MRWSPISLFQWRGPTAHRLDLGPPGRPDDSSAPRRTRRAAPWLRADCGGHAQSNRPESRKESTSVRHQRRGRRHAVAGLGEFASRHFASPRITSCFVSDAESSRGMQGIRPRADPWRPCCGAVRPVELNGRVLVQVRRAAEMSQGLPARCGPPGAVTIAAREGIAESRRISYAGRRTAIRDGADEHPKEEPPSNAFREWPAPGELGALRHRSEAAIELLQKGRHRPGVRLLRQTVGGFSLARIGSHATDSLLALASALLVGEARQRWPRSTKRDVCRAHTQRRRADGCRGP